jgi:hypothetical protein
VVAAVPQAVSARADASERVGTPPSPSSPARTARALAHTRSAPGDSARRRTARNILIEERAQPLSEAAIERLRNIAAAGGPFVQRVLRLSDDRRAIWYEAISGAAVPIGSCQEERVPRARDRVAAGRGAIRGANAPGPSC